MKHLFDDIIVVNNRINIKEKIINPIFICVISHTETSKIPGLTIAGSNSDLIQQTPSADAEFLYYGKCICIKGVPATPDGKPTPAIITRTALNIAGIPFLVVDAGVKIKPSIPFYSFGLYYGNNILTNVAMILEDVKKGYHYGRILGEQLTRSNDLVILGESIPSGTTTAMGVLLSLGIDANNKISSSMPNNPHELKNQVIQTSMQRHNIKFGEFKNQPFNAVSYMGDPMIPSVAGIATGVIENGGRVMLAGGTQMCAVLAFLKCLKIDTKKILIGTTKYILDDSQASFEELVYLIDKEIGVLAVDLHMKESSKRGLKAFSEGFVKEGVGAGGVSIASIFKMKGKINGSKLLKKIEEEYELKIEKFFSEGM
ncbi:MAG: TIGR00303 family protein [Nitrososphaeraceae archaeon]|nr:TIGR00303 family protein [Nitrososphaeraceae archaeon]